MKRIFIPALLITIFFISCGPSVQYIGRSYSPTSNVDIYFSPNDIKKEYEIMGKVDGKAFPFTDFQKIQDKIVDEAKKRGADAIIISGMNEEVVSSSKNTTTTSAGNSASTSSGSETATSSTQQKDQSSWNASISTTTTTNNQTIKVLRADFVKYK